MSRPVPDAWLTGPQPVLFCTDPSPDSLPWYHVWIRAPIIQSGFQQYPPTDRALLVARNCSGIHAYASPTVEAMGTEPALWKIVPTGQKDRYFLINKKYGILHNLSPGASLVGGFQLANQGMYYEGLLFSRNHVVAHGLVETDQWYDLVVELPSGSQVDMSSYPISQTCARGYAVGTGGTVIPFPDPPNLLQVLLESANPDYAGFPITNGVAPLAIQQCLSQTCNAYAGSMPYSCYDYVRHQQNPNIIQGLLEHRCTMGSTEQVTLDPACQVFCALPENRQACIDAKTRACAPFYDPSSPDLWHTGTSLAQKRACACFMPQAFYNQLTGGLDASNPRCIYRLCQTSPEGAQLYGTQCQAQQCYTSPGQSEPTNCFGTTPTPGPSPPEVPPAEPSPLPAPVPTTSWVWVIGIAFVVIILVVIFVALGIRAAQPKPSIPSDWMAAALWSSISQKTTSSRG